MEALLTGFGMVAMWLLWMIVPGYILWLIIKSAMVAALRQHESEKRHRDNLRETLGPRE